MIRRNIQAHFYVFRMARSEIFACCRLHLAPRSPIWLLLTFTPLALCHFFPSESSQSPSRGTTKGSISFSQGYFATESPSTASSASLPTALRHLFPHLWHYAYHSCNDGAEKRRITRIKSATNEIKFMAPLETRCNFPRSLRSPGLATEWNFAPRSSGYWGKVTFHRATLGKMNFEERAKKRAKKISLISKMHEEKGAERDEGERKDTSGEKSEDSSSLVTH